MSASLSDTIHTILLAARHAPSSHNTQPWTVRIRENTLTVGFDIHRQLTVGDPDKRELYISLGCFIESIALAAQDVGLTASVTYLDRAPEQVAAVRLTPAKGQHVQNYWRRILLDRRSDRRHYTAEPLPQEVSQELTSLSNKLITLNLQTAKDAVTFLAEQTYDATFRTMSNPAFRAELASWVRNNWTKQHDGMPAYSQGIPGPVSLFAPVIIAKNKAIAKDQAKKDSQRVAHSAAIGLICTKEQNPHAWIEAGRVYQRACLIAQQHNVKSAGVSAAIIDEATTAAIMKKLSLDATPVALMRFGYAKSNVKASPRRPLEHIITGSIT